MNIAPITYFYPGQTSIFNPSRKNIPEHRRQKFSGSYQISNCNQGPGRQSGILVCNGEFMLCYAPDKQTWKQIGENEWVGIRKDYIPQEFYKNTIENRLTAPGYRVTLADGKEYIIPVAFADSPNFNFPWIEDLSKTGEIVRKVDDAYQLVCDTAAKLYDHIQDNGVFEMDEDILRQACAVALSVNYNLDLTDCLVLGLFSSESYQAIISAILDLQSLAELAKKKAQDEFNMTSGAPDNSQITAQPLPI